MLRNRLKYALTNKECNMICMSKHVMVDGKVRTDANFPAGFMDVVEIPKSGDQFRLVFDCKSRYVLHRISDEEKKFKLCKVKRQEITKKKIPTIVTHDGRTLRYPDPLVKVNDVVKVDIETGKMVDFIRFEVGKSAMITKGRNTGRVGTITAQEKHDGAFDIVVLKDSVGNVFTTRLDNVFVIGTAENTWITLPKSEGVKLSVLEEREKVMKVRKNKSSA
jgi:ribosomal protein S4E